MGQQHGAQKHPCVAANNSTTVQVFNDGCMAGNL
jgi:hypothetical protein